MQIAASYNKEKIPVTLGAGTLSLTVPHSAVDAFVEITFIREQTDPQEYLLLPASAYNGNRFQCFARPYPPMFHPEEASCHMPVTITASAARLNEDGSGEIAVTSGDLSVPCVGIFDSTHQKSFFLFTEQQCRGINVGYTYENGVVSVLIPHRRNDAHPYSANKDSGLRFEKGESISLGYRLLELPCADFPVFMRQFFENRKCLQLDSASPDPLSTQKMWKVMEDKFEQHNYCEALGTYAVGSFMDVPTENPSRKFQVWQPGWVGGAMSSYPLMKLGSAQSYAHGRKTLDFLFSTQMPSGFFAGIVDEDRTISSDAFGEKGADDWHLLRKSADVLYFLYKHYEVMAEKGDMIPQSYLDGTRRLADAFVRLWEKYGQFGQFVSHENGDIRVGGSTSAAIAPAALAKSAAYFKDPNYLRVAEESGEYCYRLFLKDGCTTGGPGEILQCPDSESAFGLLESMVVLYEATSDEKWRRYAATTAHYCSTWVVSYNYTFPENSEFARLGMKTCGSVFANAQNKHSAPGICTLSGDSLYKLYRFTGDAKFLELIRDIARGVLQYVSRDDRAIMAKIEDNTYLPMPSGYSNERVNMSDWEQGRVGEVFYGSTWAETAALLTLAELPELLN